MYICVVESWLSCDVSNLKISLNGYDIFRQDRDRHGGGILKSELCTSLICIQTASLEFFQLTFKFYDLKFCIAVFFTDLQVLMLAIS